MQRSNKTDFRHICNWADFAGYGIRYLVQCGNDSSFCCVLIHIIDFKYKMSADYVNS